MLFRFDEDTHTYVSLETGRVVPNITKLLAMDGLVDDRWYTEESCERGKAVHKLAADFDLGALDPAACVSAYRGWLLAHVKAMTLIPHEWDMVEVARVHPRLGFGGRPDRVGPVYNLRGVLDLKSGDPEDAHAIQTALQAILVEDLVGVPAEHQARHTLYLKANGRFTLEAHPNRQDLVKARELIRRYAA